MKSMRLAISAWILIAGSLLLAGPGLAERPTWQPRASERLVKLPANLLSRSIERDYRESALARAIERSSEDVALKGETLNDLKSASESADGALRVELRHQYLAEKRAFIELMGERHAFERQRVRARLDVYAQVLGRLEQSGDGLTPQVEALIESQQAALERFEGSASKVDLALFGSGMDRPSEYASQYAQNLEGIEKLAAAIAEHPMNSSPRLEGEPVSKQTYIRDLLAQSEAQLAVLDQEESILGYMAKLVALDAMALAEGIESESDFALEPRSQEKGALVSAVDFFVN